MRNHAAIVRALPLWRGREVRVKALHGGITNFNYLVEDDDGKYVARFSPRTNALLGLNRRREIFNTKIAASLELGPQIVRFFPRWNLLVVKYIEGKILSPAMAQKPKHIRSLAGLLRTLHRAPKFRGTFNPFRAIEHYIQNVKKKRSWMPADMYERMSELKTVEKK